MSVKIILVSSAAALLLGACTPTKAVRGNMLEDYQIAAVKPGSTQTEVLQNLGSPTTVAPFDDKVWYYMGQDTEKKGIFDAKVTHERIVEVTFDDQKNVKTIQEIPNQREDIPYERRKTPTSGNEITVMQQLLGNLGKFNKDEKATAADAQH
jgi:outer membrane protein assembly factor BamE (lipoprotein component of BamABCDE complex)